MRATTLWRDRDNVELVVPNQTFFTQSMVTYSGLRDGRRRGQVLIGAAYRHPPETVIALLEGRCAFEAAGKASQADLQALAALHAQLQAQAHAGRISEYYATNVLIHEAIIALAGNRWLAQSITDLRKILKLARLQQLHAPGRLAQSLVEHLAVFAALQRRDSPGAELAMCTHLLQQRVALRELTRQHTSKVVL